MPKKSSAEIDIFGLMSDSEENAKKRKQREELLTAAGVKEFFKEGNITINKRTCWGQECRLCIKACPTNALYWKTGEIGVTEDLCVYCSACVLSCMIDDCIRFVRKREDGTVEKFGKTREVMKLERGINAKKRVTRVRDVLPSVEDYCEKHGKK